MLLFKRFFRRGKDFSGGDIEVLTERICESDARILPRMIKALEGNNLLVNNFGISVEISVDVFRIRLYLDENKPSKSCDQVRI